MMNIELGVARAATDGSYSPLAVPPSADIDEIFSLVCERGQETDGLKLSVELGELGQLPVDVKVDLPVLLEQLNEAIDAASEERRFQLDFYEQGIEKIILFLPTEGRYVVQINTLFGAQVGVLNTPIEFSSVQEMLFAIKRNFVAYLDVVCSNVTLNPAYAEWLESHSIQPAP